MKIVECGSLSRRSSRYRNSLSGLSERVCGRFFFFFIAGILFLISAIMLLYVSSSFDFMYSSTLPILEPVLLRCLCPPGAPPSLKYEFGSSEEKLQKNHFDISL